MVQLSVDELPLLTTLAMRDPPTHCTGWYVQDERPDQNELCSAFALIGFDLSSLMLHRIPLCQMAPVVRGTQDRGDIELIP